MIRWSLAGLWLAMLVVAIPPATAVDNTLGARCGDVAEVALQVLGSGGPELTGGRAGASYLVWHDGRARVLVDLGPGSMIRFNEAGARLEDLDLLALSHLHVDHAADLPVLVKAGYFGARQAPLPLVGPGAGGGFPGLVEWLHKLFGTEDSAFPYLSGALDGTEGQFELAPREFDTAVVAARGIHHDHALTIHAMPVPHGRVPSLAFRVAVAGRVIVFAGDQNGGAETFWNFADDADLLVAHLAISEDAGSTALALHARPSQLARGAAAARVQHLLLSHLMLRSETNLDSSLRRIRDEFSGEISVARDRACYAVSSPR